MSTKLKFIYLYIKMWYFISGKIMSVLCLMILSKSLKTFPDLIFFDNCMGWFLIEHIFEEYNLTAGKFFLINEDFRTLIRNLVVIIRNLIFLAQALNPLEFIVVNLILMFIFIQYKNKHFKDIVRFIILISYYLLFQSFLIFNFFVFYVLLINIFPILFFIVTLFFYSYLVYLYFILIEKKIIKNYIKIIFIKFFIYFLLINVNLCIFLFITISLFKQCDNILHELILNIIIPYSYYYIFLLSYFYNLS